MPDKNLSGTVSWIFLGFIAIYLATLFESIVLLILALTITFGPPFYWWIVVPLFSIADAMGTPD